MVQCGLHIMPGMFAGMAVIPTLLWACSNHVSMVVSSRGIPPIWVHHAGLALQLGCGVYFKHTVYGNFLAFGKPILNYVKIAGLRAKRNFPVCKRNSLPVWGFHVNHGPFPCPQHRSFGNQQILFVSGDIGFDNPIGKHFGFKFQVWVCHFNPNVCHPFLGIQKRIDVSHFAFKKYAGNGLHGKFNLVANTQPGQIAFIGFEHSPNGF